MRYNGRELAWVSRQPRGFQMEGRMFVGGAPHPRSIAHQRPVLCERWARLRGNLLFLLKSRHKESDSDEVLVLERCSICVDTQGLNSGLTISFPCPALCVYVDVGTAAERDAWAQALCAASTEALGARVRALREAIACLPRQPAAREAAPEATPEATPEAAPPRDTVPTRPPEAGNPLLEFSIACVGVPSGGETALSAFARVYTRHRDHGTAHGTAQPWRLHSRTETTEVVSGAAFLVSVAFLATPLPPRIRIDVCDARDRGGHDGVLGSAQCSVEELLGDRDQISLALISEQGLNAGEVRLQTWVSHPGEEAEDEDEDEVEEEVDEIDSPLRTPRWCQRRYHCFQRDPFLRHMFCAEWVRAYRVRRGAEAPRSALSLQERMAESPLAFHVPRELLRLRLRQLASWRSLLQTVGPLLPEQVMGPYRRLLEMSKEQSDTYTLALGSLHAHHGPAFKSSRERGEPALAFVPVNMHAQRMRVQHGGRDCTYDVVTVGAPAAHTLGFRCGGLRSLLAKGARRSVMGELGEVRTVLQRLWSLKLQFDSHRGSLATSPATLTPEDPHRQPASPTLAPDPHRQPSPPTLTPGELSTRLAHLVDTTQQLLSLCEREAVCEAVYRLTRSERRESTTTTTTTTAAADPLHTASPHHWRELLANVEDDLECLLQTSGSENAVRASVWQVARGVGAVWRRAARALLSLALESGAPWNPALAHRRDVVDAQALSALVAGCVLRLRTSLAEPSFVAQIQHGGMLVCFESLLSTYGDEQAMLEDMSVSVMELSQRVSLYLCLRPPGAKGDSLLPSLTDDDGEGLVVRVPLPAAMLRRLPYPLRQAGTVPVTTAVFSIGINEQQTLADTFHGDTSLQERLCVKSCERLRSYHERVRAYLPSLESGEPGEPGERTLPSLLEELAAAVASPRKKNVRVLHMAAEACRRLRGARVTSCKSAKDRTAMSVTLEQVSVLRGAHGLPPSVAGPLLDCMRSEGSRLENARKNVGTRRYAFHQLQLVTFPRDYRPPEGTYGKVDT